MRKRRVDKSIDDVRREEQRRGKGAPASVSRKLDRTNEEAVLKAIRTCDAELLTEILKRAGVVEGSEGWRVAWGVFLEKCPRI